MHQPYSHPDTLAFLTAIKKKFKPTRIVSIGDEVDLHSISFHDHDPDLLGPGDELEAAILKLRPIYKLFPDMDILDSNHGSLVYRKAKHHGIPKSALRTYREILDAPRGWNWHDDLTIETSAGQIYFCHSKGSDVMKVSQAMGMSVIQGHSHSIFDIRYWSNPNSLMFGMTVGCLINDKSLAFAYNRISVKRPVIGVGLVVKGLPMLVPMVLLKNGRWCGRI